MATSGGTSSSPACPPSGSRGCAEPPLPDPLDAAACGRMGGVSFTEVAGGRLDPGGRPPQAPSWRAAQAGGHRGLGAGRQPPLREAAGKGWEEWQLPCVQGLCHLLEQGLCHLSLPHRLMSPWLSPHHTPAGMFGLEVSLPPGDPWDTSHACHHLMGKILVASVLIEEPVCPVSEDNLHLGNAGRSSAQFREGRGSRVPGAACLVPTQQAFLEGQGTFLAFVCPRSGLGQAPKMFAGKINDGRKGPLGEAKPPETSCEKSQGKLSEAKGKSSILLYVRGCAEGLAQSLPPQGAATP